MRHVGFATWTGAPALTADDQAAIAPLADRGIAVVPVDWQATPLAEIAALDALVLRSCWNYHHALPAFRAWLDALEAAAVPVLNPVPVARWNLDKGYLRELEGRGVRLPRTAWVARGAEVTLAALLAAHELDEVVVKPLVSMTAYGTWRTSRTRAGADQAAFAAAVTEGAVLVQAFLPEIVTEGEISLVYLEGAFSHALRKRPRQGDFRVQADFGGTREPFVPPARLRAQAEAVLAAIPASLPLARELPYARVDGVEVGGELVLMELEVIDPELYLAVDPAAPARFADMLVDALERPIATPGPRG